MNGKIDPKGRSKPCAIRTNWLLCCEFLGLLNGWSERDMRPEPTRPGSRPGGHAGARTFGPTVSTGAVAFRIRCSAVEPRKNRLKGDFDSVPVTIRSGANCRSFSRRASGGGQSLVSAIDVVIPAASNSCCCAFRRFRHLCCIFLSATIELPSMACIAVSLRESALGDVTSDTLAAV